MSYASILVHVQTSPEAQSRLRAALALAERFDADLIAAGAYGHTRLGEWFFGGVTQDFLDQDDRYVFLSH